MRLKANTSFVSRKNHIIVLCRDSEQLKGITRLKKNLNREDSRTF